MGAILSPVYEVIFAFLPYFLATFAGTLLLYGVADILELAPAGKFLKYTIYALIFVDSSVSVISVVVQGGSFESLISNSTVILLLGLGLVFLQWAKSKFGRFMILFSYYALWGWFFLLMFLTSFFIPILPVSWIVMFLISATIIILKRYVKR